MIDHLVIIRGAGDLATGCALRLHRAGFPVIMLDLGRPTVIRRTVSFAQAMFDGECTVEGVRAVREVGLSASEIEGRFSVSDIVSDIMKKVKDGLILVAEDPEGSLISALKPDVVVDAIIAKKNLGTKKNMATLTIALGPGFTAGKDVNVVIETMRGHSLGRIIRKGEAISNTGIPALVGFYGKERVIYSQTEGVFRACKQIGDIVNKDQIISFVGSEAVRATISGKLRGLLYDGLFVKKGLKIADIDPRGRASDHTTCSDKARAIGGSVLEVVMNFFYGSFR